jgi:hypothetical protein
MSGDNELTIKGRVLACLVDRELTVVLLPGLGIGGEPHWTVAMNLVDFDARLPNTDVWVTIDRSERPWQVKHVRRAV